MGREWTLLLVLTLLAMPGFQAENAWAQTDGVTFPETGKTVKGLFLQHWSYTGGTTAYGLPISDEIQETSPIDGKTYTMQYFERAVFEAHPENQAPYNVLLSLLGTMLYAQKYPNGAQGQMASNTPDARFFPETGKHLGCQFLDWCTTSTIPAGSRTSTAFKDPSSGPEDYSAPSKSQLECTTLRFISRRFHYGI